MRYYDKTDIEKAIGWAEEDRLEGLAKAKAARDRMKLLTRLMEIKTLNEYDQAMNKCSACTWWRDGDRDTHTCGVDAKDRLAVMEVQKLDYEEGWGKLGEEEEELRRTLDKMEREGY